MALCAPCSAKARQRSLSLVNGKAERLRPEKEEVEEESVDDPADARSRESKQLLPNKDKTNKTKLKRSSSLNSLEDQPDEETGADGSPSSSATGTPLSSSPKVSYIGGHLSSKKATPLPTVNVSRLHSAEGNARKSLVISQLESNPRKAPGKNTHASASPHSPDESADYPTAGAPSTENASSLLSTPPKVSRLAPITKSNERLPPVSKQNSSERSPRDNKVSPRYAASKKKMPLPDLNGKRSNEVAQDKAREPHRLIPTIFREFSLAATGINDTEHPLSDRDRPGPQNSTKVEKPNTAGANLQPNKADNKTKQKLRPSGGSTESKPSTPPTERTTSLLHRPLRPRVHSMHLDFGKSKLMPPYSPQNVMKYFKDKLTLFEQKEILNFTEVYFYGNTTRKIKPAAPGFASSLPNEGFDDDKGDYKIISNDHIAYRYEILGILGRGAFGQVVKAFDHKSNRNVAMKIIRNKARYHQQAVVEEKILDYMKQKTDSVSSSYIVQMIESFHFRNHFCIAFELLSINLYDFIKANHFKGFNLSLVRKFAIQILGGLRFLGKHHIIHCDLKPENILLKEPTKAAVAIIDFGSSCFEHERVYSYIQSRFYRSPEVILGISYTCAIDMWSLACILAELYTGYPLFPGENEVDQLACIMEIMGMPPPKMVEIASRKKYFFGANGKPRIIENSQGVKRTPGTKSLPSVIETSDQLFLEFLTECLKWHPKERLTPTQALMHPWITEETGLLTSRRPPKPNAPELETPRPAAPMPPTPEQPESPSWVTTPTPDLPSDQPSPHSSQSSTLDTTRKSHGGDVQSFTDDEKHSNPSHHNDSSYSSTYYLQQTNHSQHHHQLHDDQLETTDIVQLPAKLAATRLS